jgi:hypothetical protein
LYWFLGREDPGQLTVLLQANASFGFWTGSQALVAQARKEQARFFARGIGCFTSFSFFSLRLIFALPGTHQQVNFF